MNAHPDNMHGKPPAGAAKDTCYLCSYPCGAPYFDTGVIIHMEGRIIIGAECAKSIIKLYEAVPKEEAAEMLAENDTAKAQTALLLKTVRSLEKIKKIVEAGNA